MNDVVLMSSPISSIYALDVKVVMYLRMLVQ